MTVTASAPPPSTRSSPRPTTISGIRSTPNTSTSRKSSTPKTNIWSIPNSTRSLRTAIGEKLDEKQKIKLVNLDTLWSFSSILHGEQGALSLSASLCHILRDPGAQEYAANQTREEARHVTGFSKFIQARWGKPVQVGPALGNILNELVSSKLVWKKLVGMQMLIEGLAMGAFATFYQFGRDPLMVKLCQLVMTDEAFHHKFGKIWADRTIPNLSKAEHEMIEDWAWEVFMVLLFNLGSPNQKEWSSTARSASTPRGANRPSWKR